MSTAGTPQGPAKRPPRDRVVLRGSVARPLAVAWFVLAAVLAADALARGSGSSAAVAVAVLALSCAAAYAVGFRPTVAYDDTGLQLRNIVRDVTVPWARVSELDTRYVLSVRTDDARRYAAWAVTIGSRGPAKAQAWRLDPRFDAARFPGATADPAAPAAEPPFGAPELLRPPTPLELLHERWRERRVADGLAGSGRAPAGAGASPPRTADPVTVRWAWPVIALLGASAVAVLVAVTL